MGAVLVIQVFPIFGGLLRNDDGAWYSGFVGNIGFSNILHAELLAVYNGLRIAWDFGMSESVCYSNSKTVMKLIKKPVNYNALLLLKR